MSTATQTNVKYKLAHDPFTGFDTHMFCYKGRYYSLNFRTVKDKLSYQLWEEYVDDDGSLAGAGEFYTSHNLFSNQQAVLKDAATTIQEMEDWESWAEDIDTDHEAMMDSHR